MKKYIYFINLCFVFFIHPAFANGYPEFTLHKIESGKPGKTILVIGGIQGDEPGGFNAAALLVTHYKILQGNVWVVPNLNFISIIKRSRGVYGDMNRKFANIKNNDPEYRTIKKIKGLILNKEVDIILNLHDGSGFYRDKHLDKMHNPQRWGQSLIIDQEQIETPEFGNLQQIAQHVVSEVNSRLYSEEHILHVKNTLTRNGNAEMLKTLTFFAISHSKPAFGLETSKSFSTNTRTYYHLLMLESFMKIAGIEYERNFSMSEKGLKMAINDNIKLAMFNNRVFLDIANARKRLGYIPFKKNSDIEFKASTPLVAIVNSGNFFRVFHGNRRLTRLYPEYLEYDLNINSVIMQIDGHEKKIGFGQIVNVEDFFLVEPLKDYRVNVIGFKKRGVSNESGLCICKNDIQKRFSVDRKGQIYRVEVYRENKFSGMILVNFNKDQVLMDTAEKLEISMAQ